jgi:hypothetical protein
VASKQLRIEFKLFHCKNPGKMKAQENKNRKKSMLITIGVHSAIFLAAMIPVATQLDLTIEEESAYVIPIEFAEFASSSKEGLKAASPVRDPEVKPVVDASEAEPDVIESETLSDVAQMIEEVEPVESEIIEETTEDVAAAEAQIEGDADIVSSAGGSDATLEDGNSQGTDASGDDEGQSGLDGDGVITRKVIHREDVTRVAEYNGTIAIDVCIDRRGYVISVAKNAEGTTITDSDSAGMGSRIVLPHRRQSPAADAAHQP